jgi:hypothetical protein
MWAVEASREVVLLFGLSEIACRLNWSTQGQKKGDQFSSSLVWESGESIPNSLSLPAMEQDGLFEGMSTTVVKIRGGVGDAPKPCRDEQGIQRRAKGFRQAGSHVMPLQIGKQRNLNTAQRAGVESRRAVAEIC